MFCTDISKADVFAYGCVQFELNTTQFKLFIAAHHNVFFQLEAWNAVSQQTASTVIAVINRDLQTRAAQNISCSQATRTSTDDSHAFSALNLRRDRKNPPLIPCSVCNIFLNRTDGDSAVT